KRVMPDAHIVFACPKKYHDACQGHPYIDEVVDSAAVDISDYVISYNTSVCCVRHEIGTAPYADKHRADIWAEHCGVQLTTHDMHLPFIAEDILRMGLDEVHFSGGPGPYVLFTPFATDMLRTLPDKMIGEIVSYLRSKDCFVYSTHTQPMEVMK